MIGYCNGILTIGSNIAIGIAFGVAIVFPLMNWFDKLRDIPY